MLRAYRQTFQGEAVDTSAGAKDLGLTEKLPAALLAVALLVVGFYPNSLLTFLNSEAAEPAAVAQTTITKLKNPGPLTSEHSRQAGGRDARAPLRPLISDR